MCVFLGKGPSQGQISGLLGYESKIPDRIITLKMKMCVWLKLAVEFHKLDVLVLTWQISWPIWQIHSSVVTIQKLFSNGK